MHDQKSTLEGGRLGELRIQPALNALWVGGAAALDEKTAVHAFERVIDAVKLASGLWPEFYLSAGVARLVHSADTPPPAEIAAAAQRLGMTLTPLDLTAQTAAENCDLALATLPAPADVVGALPVLTCAPHGEADDIAIYDAALSLLPGVRHWGRPAGGASAAMIARAILSPPHHGRETRKLRDYLHEDTHATPARFEYDLLIRALGEPRTAAGGPVDNWAAAAALAQAEGSGRAETLSILRAEYARADALALAYGRRWRSTLATRAFLLLLGSVMSGLIGTLFPALAPITVTVQLAATALMFVDRRFAVRRRWREKWIEYRRLAEAARIARVCVLAGAPTPGDGSGDWLDWRLARALRAAPPISLVPQEWTAQVLEHLRTMEIADQIAYHHAAFRRFHRLDVRLRRAAVVALVAVMGLGAVFAVLALIGMGTSARVSLIAALSLSLSAAPALHTALDSLRDRLDVARQARRSGRIAAGLRRLSLALSDAPPSPALVRAAALRAAAIMGEDVERWGHVVGVV